MTFIGALAAGGNDGPWLVERLVWRCDMRPTDQTPLRRIVSGAPRLPGGWSDDGYERGEDEFFLSPRVGRAILFVVIAVIVLCVALLALRRG